MGGEPPNIWHFMLVPSTFLSFVVRCIYQHVKQDDLIELLQTLMRYQIQMQFYIDSFFSPVIGGWVADTFLGHYNTIYGIYGDKGLIWVMFVPLRRRIVKLGYFGSSIALKMLLKNASH